MELPCRCASTCTGTPQISGDYRDSEKLQVSAPAAWPQGSASRAPANGSVHDQPGIAVHPRGIGQVTMDAVAVKADIAHRSVARFGIAGLQGAGKTPTRRLPTSSMAMGALARAGPCAAVRRGQGSQVPRHRASTPIATPATHRQSRVSPPGLRGQDCAEMGRQPAVDNRGPRRLPHNPVAIVGVDHASVLPSSRALRLSNPATIAQICSPSVPSNPVALARRLFSSTSSDNRAARS